MSTGFDPGTLDEATRPQDDLFGHVNNSWLASHTIPEDRGRFGTFDDLRERSEEHVRALIDELSAAEHQPGTTAAKVADLYRAFMDEAGLDALGADPLRPLLAQVDEVSEVGALIVLTGALQRVGVTGVLQPFVDTDPGDAGRYAFLLEQSGLGLPDESFYREESFAPIRQAYVAHIARMLVLAGIAADEDEGGERAAAIMDLETRLAAGHVDAVTARDTIKAYNPKTAAELAELAPGYDWQAWMAALQAPERALDAPIVRQPGYLGVIAETMREVDLSTWQDWLRWHIVSEYAPYLTSAMSAANFDFYGRTLSGIPAQRARWKRGVGLVEAAIGEAVGELYVERHFPPSAKEAMNDLVANVVEAFRRSFSDLEWMGEQTRAEALTKLGSFVAKVGYPDRWRDYSALEIDGEDLIGSIQRATEFEIDRMFAKFGGPIDRGEWFLTPQTVNAYYHPGMNEIVFPAAILQPPFFDVDADPALNYGGIGAVIGHEIGHGFDDQGSTYDGTGTLRDWWTAEDRARFTERAERLIAQFSELETRDAPGEKVNGGLTVGENIGDLGGLQIGHAAYRIASEKAGVDPHEVGEDGLTGDQRFFIGWARVWRGLARREEAKRLLTVDPHAPMDLRGNAVRNVDAFHEAFGSEPGDGLWVDPAERVTVF